MREDELAPVDKVDIDRLLKEKPAWKELKGKLIEWADKANQVIEILQKMPLDDWLKLRRYYPKGLKGSAHVLNQKLVEAQKMTAGDALKFQKDEVSSKGMDPAENRANASVFADGRLIFMLNEPYLSGVKCTASEFGTLHAVVLNTPHTLALEKEISHNDSEVALLHDLDRQMTLHEPELKGAKEIVINIYSKLGACDPCKDRIDAFLLKHPTAVVRYYYRKYKPLDTSQESRKTSYGWEKDEKEKVGNKEVFVHEVHYSPKLDAVREGIDYVLQKTFAAVAVRLWTLKVWLIKVPTQPTGNANPIS